MCARVVLVEGAVIASEARQRVARDTMASHKVPSLARVCDALPMTGSGMPTRREIECSFALDHTAIIGST